MSYGFTSNDASVILSSVNDAGACSYASVCGDILEHFQDKGFLFGVESRKFFITSYSVQNGCYKSDIEVYFNNKRVLEVDCEMILS